MSYLPALEVLRGDIVESIHHASVAVVDSTGKLTATWGSPDVTTYMRSSAKPFQILPMLELGGVERFGFTLREIAIMCASHSGTDEHVRTVASVQEKVGLEERHLLCGTHPPIHEETALRLKVEGLAPTPRRHNCSGKHSGMLAMAKLLDATLEDYVNVEHPIQKRILKTMSEICDVELEEISIGVDGCSVPTFALPLKSAALGFARLADPSQLEEGMAKACRTVWEAMIAHPEMVAGPGRFDTALIRVADGVLIAKGGAEGYQGLAIAPGSQYEGSPALGVALKIADGDGGGRGRSIVALKVLEDLGVLSSAQLQTLAAFGRRKHTNWREIEVGELRPCFQLQQES